jgi:hypothetical protein
MDLEMTTPYRGLGNKRGLALLVLKRWGTPYELFWFGRGSFKKALGIWLLCYYCDINHVIAVFIIPQSSLVHTPTPEGVGTPSLVDSFRHDLLFLIQSLIPPLFT